MEKTTRPYSPFELIFSIECDDQTEARKYEKFDKSGGGKEILKRLIFWQAELVEAPACHRNSTRGCRQAGLKHQYLEGLWVRPRFRVQKNN
jgi:hypothetical protein